MVSKATTEAVAGSAGSVLAMLATFPLKVTCQRAQPWRRTLTGPLVCNVSYLPTAARPSLVGLRTG